MKHLLYFSIVLLLSSCARGPIKDHKQTMRPSKTRVNYSDDLKLETLVKGIEDQI